MGKWLIFLAIFGLSLTMVRAASAQVNVGRFQLVSVSSDQQTGVFLIDTASGCTWQLGSNPKTKRFTFVEMDIENLHWSWGSGAQQKLAKKIEESKLSEEQQQLLKAIPSLWPLKGYVTREFYTTGGEKSDLYHPGMDIAARRNTPVQTSAEGIVVTSGWDETFGYQVTIDHGFGIQTLYGHNSRNIVKEGDRVVRGQTVAFVGNTGESSAPHLHFEVKKNGVPVDPRNYLLN